MNTAIALMMAALFSYWIWMLKQQIESLRQTATGKTGSIMLPKAHAAPEKCLMQRKARETEGGIPTWTL
jgi:hypothetical protein